MENSQDCDGHDNHDTVENHKGGLVVGKCTVEASAEFGNTKAGSNQYSDCGDE